MNVQQAYTQWSTIYDSNINKTRDLEALALKETLTTISFNTCLEIGCGTGKNTVWLSTKASYIKAIDLTDEMLLLAKEKINSLQVEFEQADITKPWHFANKKFDLISFSLVLEHIENLDDIFEKCFNTLTKDGYMYIGELHPFKQYSGSKARFETEAGTQIVTCFTHHISEFTSLAKKYNFSIIALSEYFDEDDKNTIPRILTLVLQKK